MTPQRTIHATRYVTSLREGGSLPAIVEADDCGMYVPGPTLFDHTVKPDLVAPGNRIISHFVTGGKLESSYPGNLVPISYYKNVGN